MARVSGLTKHLSDNPDFKVGYERAQSYIHIGMTLRQLREAKNLTQQELAKLTDVDQADISRIENGKWGKRGISLEALERILPVFGLRISRAVETVPGADVTPAAQKAVAEMTELLTVV